jgi:hypothetical protein
VYRDLCAGMMSSFAPAEEVHRPAKPVQLDLLAA